MQLQAVLDRIKENDVHGGVEGCEKRRVAVYVPKETALKKMRAKIDKLSQNFFF
jgi:hypothetical protein